MATAATSHGRLEGTSAVLGAVVVALDLLGDVVSTVFWLAAIVLLAIVTYVRIATR
jgi:hypothetical protein